MTALTLVQSIANTITTGSEAEINSLRDEAEQRIGTREVARTIINRNLHTLPEIVTGEHLVSYKDDRDEVQEKMQARNLSLWVVALQTTIETGHTTYELLGAIFEQWAKETLGCKWDLVDAIKIATLYVVEMREMGILNEKREAIEFINEETNVPMNAKVNKLSPETQEMMAEVADDLRAATHMRCKPLTNQPADWINTECGVGVNAGLKLIKNQKYKGNKIDARVLSAVNKLQAVAFVIAPAMIDVAYDILDNQAEYAPKEERDLRVFENELNMYREVIAMEGGTFYFPVTMDTRGRMYYRGGLLTPQGTDFCKAAFQFAESKPLGDTGLDAICIHLAGTLGWDKDSFDDRMYKVQAMIDAGQLDAINDHRDVIREFPQADTMQATVALLELKRILEFRESALEQYQEGVAIDFPEIESNLVCHQDGTCNGLQHMAALTHNLPTAIAVNCVESSHSDKPSDIYGIIALEARTMTTGEVSALIGKYGRGMAKNPVMITGYGAGEETIIKNTAKYLAEHGENTKHASDIGKAYVAAMNLRTGAVRTLTEAMKARVAQAIEQGITRIKWKTADGFLACTEYRDIEGQRIRAGVFNALMTSDISSPLDQVKTEGAMSPNFVHSIDATHLRMVINDCDHDLVTVHDSIGSHPANYFATAKSIREQFVAVHDYDALGNLCEGINVRTPKFRGEYNASEALKSSYIFS